MIFDVWTILNPILRTFIYFSVLTTIGTILFSLHFSNFFDNIVKVYCQNLIKKFSIFGLFIGLLVFLSVAGNLGGDFQSVIDISLIMLSFETLSGKSAILLTTGFTLIISSILNYKFFPVLFQTLGILSILFSFVIIGHSTIKGISTQTLLMLHIICISFWLGSFLPLRYMCINKNFKNLIVISEKFGFYAIFYVAILVIVGLVFSYILVGNIDGLFSTIYGNILLLKFILVSILLSIGALNKLRLVPYLKIDYKVGKYKLKKSIEIEGIISLIILILTSILTTSLPTPMGI
jgi:putative copper resistance protein D